jgi:hypothetical protein
MLNGFDSQQTIFTVWTWKTQNVINSNVQTASNIKQLTVYVIAVKEQMKGNAWKRNEKMKQRCIQSIKCDDLQNKAAGEKIITGN